MHINDSICYNCKYFWHECNVDDMGDGGYCAEYCYNEDSNVQDNFYFGEDVIRECKGFESK